MALGRRPRRPANCGGAPRRSAHDAPYRSSSVMTSQKFTPDLPHAPALPREREVATYSRFGASYEPWEYSDWIDESMSWKNALYIGDWSPLGKLRVQGRDALTFFSDIAVNSFAK